MVAEAPAPIARILGRYALGKEIARGGLASVHVGLGLGEVGFTRTVAIKRLLPAFASDAELVASFVDEAKLASRVRHPNVVPTLDVVTLDGEVFVVMEYVHGESLSTLLQLSKGLGAEMPRSVASAVFVNVLHGLQAAHEATDERGTPLGIIHRDMSPQNVLVGADGVARVLDFGIAKASSSSQVTREGQVKGKLAYMAPEQLAQNAEQTSDIYSTAVCLWEALTMRRLFSGDNESAVLAKVIAGLVDRPSRYGPDVSPELDALVLRALDRNPKNRFPTARDMADALEQVLPPASINEVREWVDAVTGPQLSRRLELIAEVEQASRSLHEKLPTPEIASVDAATSVVPQITASSTLEKRGWRPWAVIGSLVVGIAALLFGAFRIGGLGTAVAEPASPPTLAPLGRVAVTTPTGRAIASTSVAPEPATTAVASAHQGPNPKQSVLRPPPPPRINCDPPYSVGPDGIQRYKKECLK
jgi:serine/threonine-protein kinase